MIHPNEVLFAGEKPFPVLPACEHFAGSEKLICKSFEMMDKLGPLFNITCDCEDGAPAGREKDHAEMIVDLLTSRKNHNRMAGVRIHDYTHPLWKQDADILIKGAGKLVTHITIPKVTCTAQAAGMIAYIQEAAIRYRVKREIPIHVLIETHGGLRDVWEIARLPWLEVLDFGLMDFISDHHGAIPADAMRSPGQFEHRLVVRAKTEIAAAAYCNGLVPSHNITLDLKNPNTAYDDARHARLEFGYLRQWSIHPSQINPIVNAMKPDNRKVEIGAAVLLAAQQTDWGPIRYEGELYDRASYRYYWELLRMAKATGVTLPPEAERAFYA